MSETRGQYEAALRERAACAAELSGALGVALENTFTSAAMHDVLVRLLAAYLEADERVSATVAQLRREAEARMAGLQTAHAGGVAA